jgi:hypothetical protein
MTVYDPANTMPEYLRTYLADYELRVRYEQNVNNRLRAHGAKVFGSLRRREERLRRFDEAEAKRERGRLQVEEARQRVREEIKARAAARADEIRAMIEADDCLVRLWRSIQNGFVRVTRG